MSVDVTQPPSVLNPNSGEIALNMKRLIEDDNEYARRRHSNDGDYDKALNSFNLTVKEDNHSLRYLSAVALLTSQQTGETENQQNTSPMDQAAAEANKGAVGTANAAVAASVGNLASALVPIITASGGIVTAQTLAAL